MSLVESVGTESGSEDELLSPPREKARKLCGAAKYRTKFKSLWKGEFPFIASVPGDPYR